MKRLILIIFIINISHNLFTQDSSYHYGKEFLNHLINYLNKEVPEGAQRMNRTEYSMSVPTSGDVSVTEIFEVSEGKVIMAAIKWQGNSGFIQRFFGGLFDEFDFLGEPLVSSRNAVAWYTPDIIIMIQHTEKDNNISSVILYTLLSENLEVFTRIMGG